MQKVFSRATATPRNASTKRCYTCNGRFGLVRYRVALKQFCSKLCLEKYKANTDRQASRSKQWIDFLTGNQ
jgi:hypothetical protein